MLKGTMKIEMTDVNTGQTETVLEQNMVTNALANIFKPLGLVKDPGRMYDGFAPYYQKLLGGLLLFDNTIEENADGLYPPANAGLVGCAVYGQQNNTTGKVRGSFNQTESELNLTDRYMKYVYDFMKKHHPFLTSSDDYCRIALISINSRNLDEDLEYIEECYEKLSKNGFYKSNNLQSLSQIMCFDKERNDESINKIVRLKNLLDKEKCKIDSYAYPIIGAIALLDCSEDIVVNQIKNVSNKLKEVIGFGDWS